MDSPGPARAADPGGVFTIKHHCTAATSRRRPPQVAQALRSEENTRASKVADRSRWVQDGALEARSAAKINKPRRSLYQTTIPISTTPTELYDLEKDLANRFAHSTETNFRQSGFIAIYSSSRMSFIGLLTAALTAWNATGKKATAIPKRMAPMVNCDQTRLTCPPQVQIRQ